MNYQANWDYWNYGRGKGKRAYCKEFTPFSVVLLRPGAILWEGARAYHMFNRIRLRRKLKREIREKKRICDARTRELDVAMDLLIKNHPVVPSKEELYLYISYYAHCHEEWEDRYCKRYLWDRIRRGYLRIYDDSRLTE